MLTLISGVVKSLVVDAEVSTKKTLVTIDLVSKNASCRIDLSEPLAPGATPSPYAGLSNIRVNLNLSTVTSTTSSDNVTDVDAAANIAKQAVVKMHEIVAELGIVVEPQTV